MNDGLFLTFLASAMAASTAVRSWSPNMATTDANEQVVLWLWCSLLSKGPRLGGPFPGCVPSGTYWVWKPYDSMRFRTSSVNAKSVEPNNSLNVEQWHRRRVRQGPRDIQRPSASARGRTVNLDLVVVVQDDQLAQAQMAASDMQSSRRTRPVRQFTQPVIASMAATGRRWRTPRARRPRRTRPPADSRRRK